MLVQTQQLDTVSYEAVSLPPACVRKEKAEFKALWKCPPRDRPRQSSHPQLGRSIADGDHETRLWRRELLVTQSVSPSRQTTSAFAPGILPEKHYKQILITLVAAHGE